MSSIKGDYCNIEKFDPSSRTADAIANMNHIIDMASLLDRILMAVPFFQIFAGRSTYTWASFVSTGWQVSQTDWQTFEDALKSVDSIKRARLQHVASEAALYSIGEEGKFWRCVSNAI